MPHLASPPCYTESVGVVMLPADNGLPLAAPALPLLTHCTSRPPGRH